MGGGTVTRTFTIVTTFATWLGEAAGDAAARLKPAGDDVLRVWQVSEQVNSPRSNGAELLEAMG
jgi:putative SOS response-associated peptidase YedK